VYELSAEGLEAYEGGYTEYQEEKEHRRERLASLVEAQDKKRRRLEADIAMTARQAQYTERTIPRRVAPKFKRYAKKVAKKSKAREHRLQREMASETWLRAPREPAAFKVRLESPEGGRRLIVALRGLTVPGVLEDVSLVLHAGDRVALTGPNGSGKTTLLHALADAEVNGVVRLLPQTPVRLPDMGVLEWFRNETSLPESEARTLLAHYRLGVDAIDRPLATLSPGERARVHVAAIVGAGADLILLDEPTNHLDFDTLEIIEAALRAYRGTLVVATHDRRLIEAVECDQVLTVRDRAVFSENASAISS
jgi:macrolide transport system ATP-binding/permease protein